MSNTGKILLICDNKSSSSHLKEQLLGWGNYTVIEESSGQAGIVSLSRGICDLVIKIVLSLKQIPLYWYVNLKIPILIVWRLCCLRQAKRIRRMSLLNQGFLKQ